MGAGGQRASDGRCALSVLLSLPECRIVPADLALRAAGWTSGAMSWDDEKGAALVTREGVPCALAVWREGDDAPVVAECRSPEALVRLVRHVLAGADGEGWRMLLSAADLTVRGAS